MSQSPVITVLATALCLTFLAESRGATMFEPQRLPMRAEEFEIARRRMLAEISARAVQLRETTGRAAFDERVMAAMGRVRLRQHSTSYRLQQDNLAALHCRVDDGST